MNNNIFILFLFHLFSCTSFDVKKEQFAPYLVI